MTALLIAIPAILFAPSIINLFLVTDDVQDVVSIEH